VEVVAIDERVSRGGRPREELGTSARSGFNTPGWLFEQSTFKDLDTFVVSAIGGGPYERFESINPVRQVVCLPRVCINLVN
jgi:hypothetical protein